MMNENEKRLFRVEESQRCDVLQLCGSVLSQRGEESLSMGERCREVKVSA